MSICNGRHYGLLSFLLYELSLPPVTAKSFAEYIRNLRYIEVPSKAIGDVYRDVMLWHCHNKSNGEWGGKTYISLSENDRGLVYDTITTTYTFGRPVDAILGVRVVFEDHKPTYIEIGTDLPGSEFVRFDLSEENDWRLPGDFAFFLRPCVYNSPVIRYDSQPESIEVLVAMLDRRQQSHMFEHGTVYTMKCGVQMVYDKGMGTIHKK